MDRQMNYENKNMLACPIENCGLDVEAGFEQCILHCNKGDYGHDFQKTGFLNRFYQALAKDVARQVREQAESLPFDEDEILAEIIDAEPENTSQIAISIQQSTLLFGRVHFPDRDGRDLFDYQKVLKQLRGIHFDRCVFSVRSYSLGSVQCFFQDCIFKQEWYVPNLSVLGNHNDVVYQNCRFKGDVSASGESGRRLELQGNQFHNCEFEGDLALSGVNFSGCIFKSSETAVTNLRQLTIDDCRFDAKFLGNALSVDSIIVRDTEFRGKSELKASRVSSIEVMNCNFSQIFDGHGTEFGKFRAERCIFSDFVGFEECEFGSLKNHSDIAYAAVFEYVTFHEFVNFRKARFRSGLDLENANFRVPPNFLKADVGPVNTSRETFRIIKFSFDSVGNKIEGNRYFADEMRKYKEDLSKEPWSQEKLIFYLNGLISNFGQSYLRPLTWLLAFSLLFKVFAEGYEQNWLYSIYPVLNPQIETIAKFCNDIAISFLPFSKLLRGGMEFVSLVFYIVFASLIWQVIVAVKRHTRR